MNPERWRRIKELHARALELPGEDRLAWLEVECAGDQELVEQVRTLLGALEPEDAFLAPPDIPELNGGSEKLPRRLGDFELLAEIGRGGMGVVYRARQLSLEREVAVKVLPPHITVSRRQIDRFLREARAAAGLSHPAIAPVYSVGREGEVHYFAMELVQGSDLAREILRLREGGGGREPGLLPAADSSEFIPSVARLCAEIADGLHYAHQQGIVHRDVKPHNILLEPRTNGPTTQRATSQGSGPRSSADRRAPGGGRPRLVDFGMARDASLGSITQSGGVQGTPYYMSPEQAQVTRSEVDHRTDVYSLGVVLYELLTLKRPFEGQTSHDVIVQIGLREPAPIRRANPRVPRDLEVICNKAMAKSVAARYASAAELADDLRRFVNHEAILARPPSVAERLGAVLKRRRGVLAAGLVGLVIAASGGWFTSVRAAQARLEGRLEPLRELALGGAMAGVGIEELVRARAEIAALRAAPDELADGDRRLLDELDAGIRAHAEALRRAAREGFEAVDPGEPYLAVLEAHTRGLTDLLRSSLLVPEDERIAEQATLAYWYPRLGVALAPGAQLPGARVTALPMDLSDGSLGAALALGGLPLAPVGLPPGAWRILLRGEGGAGAEVELLLERPRQLTGLELAPVAEARATAGMVRIPGREFITGSGDLGASPFPERRTEIASFWIDRTEVSNGAYREFVLETGHPAPLLWGAGYDPTLDELPVVGVSFSDAQAYAAWAGKRLPTILEWELAARSSDGRTIPWLPADRVADPEEIAARSVLGRLGATPAPPDDFEALLAQQLELYRGAVVPVGQSTGDESPEGLLHLLGNVAEWTSTPFQNSNAAGTWQPQLGQRTVKGGDFLAPPFVNLEHSRPVPADATDFTLGFRCARSAVR